MAKAKHKTAQQKLKQKERRNLRRRTQTAIKNLERELSHTVEFDLTEFLTNRRKPLSAQQLSTLRGEKLLRAIEKHGRVVFKEGESVTMREYNEVLKTVAKAQKLAKEIDSRKEIKPPTAVESVRGFTKFKEFVNRAATTTYWREVGNRMIDNFMESMSALGTTSIGYVMVARQIKKLGKAETVRRLTELVYSGVEAHISVAYYFSSNQEEVQKNLKDVFDFLGIPWDGDINYGADINAPESEKRGGMESATDEEVADRK